jgi:hypothetical protein
MFCATVANPQIDRGNFFKLLPAQSVSAVAPHARDLHARAGDPGSRVFLVGDTELR